MDAAEEWAEKLVQEVTRDGMVWLSDFADESDRGCALLVGAQLEQWTTDLLLAHLMPDEPPYRGLLKSLTRGSGPLATHSSRADLLYLLGALPESARAQLKAIAKVRNGFAHHPDRHTFDNAGVRRDMEAVVMHFDSRRHSFVAQHEPRHTTPDAKPLRQKFMAVAWNVGVAVRLMSKYPHVELLRYAVRRVVDARRATAPSWLPDMAPWPDIALEMRFD